MKVVFKDNLGYPAEIYSKGLTYSMLDKDFVAMHRPIRCKDFFQDLIWAETKKQTGSIYGFVWKPTGEILNALAMLFNVSTDYLLGNTDIKNQKQFDDDLEKSLDTFKSFDGKPMYDEDREKIREFLRQRMEDRLKDK